MADRKEFSELFLGTQMSLPATVSLRTAVLLQVPAIVALLVWQRRRLRTTSAGNAALTASSGTVRHSAAIEAAARVSREIPLRCARSTAVVVIDMQTFCCDLERGGCWRDGSNQPSDYLRETLPAVVDNIATLLGAARQSSVECIFTVIESLTADGRDRSLDYKVSGFNVPRGSKDAQVLAALQPADDEMVLPKCGPAVVVRSRNSSLLS